jgi:hypothetical protein
MDYLILRITSAVIETMLNRQVDPGNGHGISHFHIWKLITSLYIYIF